MSKLAAPSLTFVAALLLAGTQALAGPAVSPLVSTQWLAENLGSEGLVILDIRAGATFEVGHIPGSQQTDYPGRWRATRDDVPWVLPEIADLEVFLSALGVGPSTSVVVVPAGSGSTELGGATWIYWVLKHLGHEAVAVLDGGFTAWSGEGRALESGPMATVPSAEFTASIRPEILASTAYVAARVDTDVIIIDARPPSQYEGATQSGLVTRAGHIPGAINLDNARFYDVETNRLKSIDGLQAELPAVLADRSVEILSYCNTGHWGSINWFVLHELLGFTNTRLYEGSMAAWSRDLSLPITLGTDS